MREIRNTAFLAATFIICFAAFALSAQFAFAANGNASLVSVEYIGVNPNVESITTHAPSISGDTQESLSSARLGGDRTLESAFLLRSQKALVLKFYTAGDFTAQGIPAPGDILAEHQLQKGEIYLFRHLVPEGMPNLLVCAQDETERLCWIPRFSGVDGSVELDPGFILFKKD